MGSFLGVVTPLKTLESPFGFGEPLCHKSLLSPENALPPPARRFCWPGSKDELSSEVPQFVDLLVTLPCLEAVGQRGFTASPGPLGALPVMNKALASGQGVWGIRQTGFGACEQMDLFWGIEEPYLALHELRRLP